MEWTKTSAIPDLLRELCNGHLLQIAFTQWEDDDLDADEDVSTFEGYLAECSVSKNAFTGLDAAFHFQYPDSDEIIEILMDFPEDEEDVVASLVDGTVHLFGNESSMTISKRS